MKKKTTRNTKGDVYDVKVMYIENIFLVQTCTTFVSFSRLVSKGTSKST